MSVVYRRERGLVLALLTGLVAGQYLETRVAFGLCYIYIVILWFNTVIKLLRIKILLPFQNIGHMVYVGFFYWSVMSVVYRRERGLVLALLTGLVAAQYLVTRVAFGLCYMYF